MKHETDSKPTTTDDDSSNKKIADNKDNDSKTDEIVDDIIAKESDEILAAEDERITKAFSTEKPNWRTKIKDFFVRWWQNPTARKATIIGGAILVVAIIIIPFTRYFILNNVGIRSSSSIRILDESTQQPLNNVSFNVRGQTAQTDKDGKATLKHIKLGSTEMVIEKRGFAVIKKKVVIGWGSNPLGTVKLSPRGTQFVLGVTDYLSGKPVSKIEATSGYASALSDEKGMITITIEKPDDEVKISINSAGYREEKLTFSSTTKDTQNVKLVPGRNHAFISKRSGKYDLYKVDIDNKNEQVVMAGTGSERNDIALVAHPTDNVVAVVSTREKVYNSDGYLMSTLTLVNLTTNITAKVAQSESIRVVNWAGSRLVYVQIVAGVSGGNPKRSRLISYDYKTKATTEITSANYFNDIQIIDSKIYHAASAIYASGGGIGLFRSDGDGANKKTILQQEVTNMFRTGFDMLDIAEGSQWFSYIISSGAVTKLPSGPSNPQNRVYMNSPDALHSVWVDIRDGKGVMLLFSINAAKETMLKTQNGLKNPVYWLNNNTIVYRLANGQGTADYAINIDGGDAKKISDVTDTGSVGFHEYY